MTTVYLWKRCKENKQHTWHHIYGCNLICGREEGQTIRENEGGLKYDGPL